MTPDERRAILDAVARGELTPEEAAEQLAGEARAADPPTRTMVEDRVVRRLRVRTTAGAVKIIGDPTVTEADVSGPSDAYELRTEGDELAVEVAHLHRVFDDYPGRSEAFTIRSRRGGGRLRVHGLTRGLPFQSITVRVNPDLPIAIDVTAGSVSASGLRGSLDCSVDAGALSLRDVRGPIQGRVTAGSLSYQGVLDHGESELSCDMGALSVVLDEGSSVRARVEVTLGRRDLKLSGRPDGDDFVVGSGAGSLTIDGTMSSVTVRER